MWVLGGGGLYGYFREQGVPVGDRSVLNDFTDEAGIISVAICSKMGQSEWWKSIEDGGYIIAL